MPPSSSGSHAPSPAALLLALSPRASRWETGALEIALGAALDAGRAAWPDVGLGAADFIQALARRLPDDTAPWPASPAEWLGRLSVSDFYLATACLLGDKQAFVHLEQSFIRRVPSFVAQMRLGTGQIEDVVLSVRSKLLVGNLNAEFETRRPVLSEYSGRGALDSWLRVISVRVALDLIDRIDEQEDRKDVKIAERLIDDLQTDPETAAIKARYREECRSALAAAVRALDPQQRSLLHMHFIARVPTTKLGPLHGVSQPTIWRWIEAAREQLVGDVKKALKDRLRLSDSEYQSVVRMIQSQLQSSLERLLGS